MAERAAGQRMYQKGILPSGEPMAGLAFGGLVRRGADAACIGCHRRSGFGIAEGDFVIRPIAGADLYQTRDVNPATPRIAHQLGVPLRPAYDDTALAQTLRTGIDITGRSLNGMMPRYALGDAEMNALISYLKSLSEEQAPGVTGEEIHLATVIQPGVPDAKRRAMLDVLHAFIRDKNAGVRSEAHRRSAGAMRMHRAYRKWTLHVWQLDGPDETWGAQLQAHYRRQPVFALVSGIGMRSWRPIHDFSERFQVPCIFPLTALPAVAESGFYTVYFSRGLALEADGLAKHLLGKHPGRRIVQAYRREGGGAAAAAAFRSALAQRADRLEDIVVEDLSAEALWRELAVRDDAVIALWLGAGDLESAALHAMHENAPQRPIYLSASLLGGMAAPAGARLVYPWELPFARAAKVLRTQYWLRSRQIASGEEEVQINAYFAMTVAGEALTHMMDSFSREYFVERVEHGVTSTLAPSWFPKLGLGPDQRFASKGVYIVSAGAPGGNDVVPESGLIVP